MNDEAGGLSRGARVRGLSVSRKRQSGPPQRVLEDLCFEIAEGERVAVVGPNGAGKTTLLWALVGATRSEGRIEIAGHLATPESLDSVRREVGLVFADPGDQLFLPTVLDEVAFGPEQLGLPAAEVSQRVAGALAAVGLCGFESRPGAELSLGEQKRLAVATVLAMRPKVLLLDEPTASLDPRARREMIRAISGTPATVVLATHDLEAVLDLEARVLLLDRGRLIADGPARSLLADETQMLAAGLEVPLSIRLGPPAVEGPRGSRA